MSEREDALLEIYERIKEQRILLGLTSFKRTPTNPISESDMPCVFMLEGNDIIIKHSSRGNTGYPSKRTVEVTLEAVTNKETNIKTLIRNLRKSVFSVRGTGLTVHSSKLLSNSTAFINENRMEGPTGYGLPDVLGMSLVLDLVYTDDGY